MNVISNFIKYSKILLSSGRSIFVLISILALNLNVFSQCTIKGLIPDAGDQTVYFCSEFGDNIKLLDSITLNSSGEFEYTIGAKQEQGLYAIYFNNIEGFNLIVNNEKEIEFLNLKKNFITGMSISMSEENKLFYLYKVEQDKFERKIEIVENAYQNYPQDSFKLVLYKELVKLTQELNFKIDSISALNPNLLSAKLIKYYKKEMPINNNEQLKYQKDNYFKNFPLNEVSLLNTNAFSTSIVGYLKLNANAYTRVELIANYKNASDVILTNSAVNQEVFEYNLKYLMEGFEKIGLNEVLEYVAAKYQDKCKDEDSNLALRLKSYSDLKIGNTMPDLKIKSKNEHSFDGFTQKYTLIVFWATWCEHCKQTIPNLIKAKDLFDNFEVEVVTISLDKDINFLNNFVDKINFPFKVLCDEKSWESKAAIDFAVYATPSMFLINQDGKLLQKPFYINDLIEFLYNNNND